MNDNELIRREKEDRYLKLLGKKKLYRFMAMLGLLVIVGLLIATFVSAVMASKYFMPFLVLTIVVSVLIYAALWLGRVFFKIGEVDQLKKELENLK